MSKHKPAPKTKASNWKLTLTLVGILALILVLVVPLALLNSGDDRNRPAASDTRHIAAILYPKHDADVPTKGEWAFLENCRFKDCALPVLVLDNAGQIYRYLIQPGSGKSLAMSANQRAALFVDKENQVYSFFNGGLTTLGTIATDMSGAVSGIHDDGSAVLAVSGPRESTTPPALLSLTNGQLSSREALGMHGHVVSCDGQTWRFDNEAGANYQAQPATKVYAYNFGKQTFEPAKPDMPAPVAVGATHTCVGDGKGSVAFWVSSDPANPKETQRTLWTWTPDAGFTQDAHIYQLPGVGEGEVPHSFGVKGEHLWVLTRAGKVHGFHRTTGEAGVSFDMNDRFSQTNGVLSVRAQAKDGRLYVIGKSLDDPERWTGAIYNLATGKGEKTVHLAPLTDNYLDAYLDAFILGDAKALESWFATQPEI